MITTITTEAVAAITPWQATALGMLATVTLLALLMNRELIASSPHAQAQRLSKSLMIAVAPLVLGFLMIAAIKFGGLL
ncbi:MAG TPA: hypothetical protein VKY74_16305 [Chloroflexia bacterium]|nr:hypothetical protein [Chloroflexia bacterium]